MPPQCDDDAIISYAKQILQTEAQAVQGLIPLLGPDFVQAVQWILQCRGRVVLSGMGKSWLISQKISATLASTGTPSLSLHPAEAIHGDLGRVVGDDILLALSNGGETAEIIKLLSPVKKIGARIIAMTGNPAATLARHSDLVLDIGKIDEACHLGLAPSASSTAMLALGDALALCVSKNRNFTREAYALFHPGGSLGRKLMKVAEIMRQGEANPVVHQNEPVSEVLYAITRSRAGAASVVDGQGRLCGIFTDGDLRRHLRRDPQVSCYPVARVMTPNPQTVSGDTLVVEALRLLREKKIDELPVIDEQGRPIGLLDVQDILDVGSV